MALADALPLLTGMTREGAADSDGWLEQISCGVWACAAAAASIHVPEDGTLVTVQISEKARKVLENGSAQAATVGRSRVGA